jgi:hypothetical protein
MRRRTTKIVMGRRKRIFEGREILVEGGETEKDDRG